MYAWTPYQTQAMAARLKTGHRLPQMPKEALLTTGNPMWYVAPMRPVKHTKQAAMAYPIHTQSHDCHHERPPTTIEDEIIQVLSRISNTRASENPAGDALDIERVGNPKADLGPGVSMDPTDSAIRHW